MWSSLFLNRVTTTMRPFILIILALTGITLGDQHGPCANKDCRPGYVCKVFQAKCGLPPCLPFAKCVIKNKLGNCPEEGVAFGICGKGCVTDADCSGRLKCCGNCPPVCTKPISDV